MSALDEPQVRLDGTPFPGPWRRQGACRVVPTSVFFPPRGTSPEPAKAVCRACPVREQCSDYAIPLGDLKGIWGGLAEVERRRLRRAGGAQPPSPSVATPASARPRPRRSGPLYRTLEELTASPGRWARVALYPAPYTAAGMAGRLRAGSAAAPAGVWRFEARQNDDGTSGLWAYYAQAHLEVTPGHGRRATSPG